jgi:hypothetical protein
MFEEDLKQYLKFVHKMTDNVDVEIGDILQTIADFARDTVIVSGSQKIYPLGVAHFPFKHTIVL